MPVENASMEDRSVFQWDKDDLDALGLLKVDLLALGMLTAIHRTLNLLQLKTGREFRMQDIPAEDPATYAMIRKADRLLTSGWASLPKPWRTEQARREPNPQPLPENPAGAAYRPCLRQRASR